MRRIPALLALFIVLPGSLLAALTPEQRVLDFQILAALYAKRYAPYEWKRQLFEFDLFDSTPWLARVRQAKDDLEYFEISAEYVANLDDLHSSYRVPSSFAADLGLFVDIYDGKVLIEGVNRMRLPSAEYPFQVGDELVAVDGKTPEEWIAEFSRYRKRGNSSTTRRGAADLITFRPQSVLPRASEIGDSALVEIRRAGGDVESYTIPWVKTGVPLNSVGPVPLPKGFGAARSTAGGPDYLQPLREMRQWQVPGDDHLFLGTTYTDDGTPLPRRYLLGYGGRFPVFRAGFPREFVQRTGAAASDFHFSGVYEAGGSRIGYLRIPNFGPPNTDAAIQELEREVRFFEANTDGLVVDVMRNTGGGCYMLDAAARLIPHEFFFFGEEIRVTQERINSLQFALEAAQRAQADQWVVDTYQFYIDQLKRAYSENRGRTGSIPACTAFRSASPAGFMNLPAAVVYTKPIIFLIDEFSTSAGDIFPAMMQDNRRGALVGTRTNGAGGSISVWPAGFYSEAVSSNTNTLVVRREPVVTGGYPVASYIENIGAHPDIVLDYMTRDNLMNQGRPFVEAFTSIIVQHIQASGRP
jgi:hypothetical protein